MSTNRPTPEQILARLPKGDALAWVNLGEEAAKRLAEHGYVIASPEVMAVVDAAMSIDQGGDGRLSDRRVAALLEAVDTLRATIGPVAVGAREWYWT